MGKLCPQKISNFVFYYAPGSGSGARFLYYVPIPKNLPPKSIQFQVEKTKRTRMICSMLLVLIVFFFGRFLSLATNGNKTLFLRIELRLWSWLGPPGLEERNAPPPGETKNGEEL